MTGSPTTKLVESLIMRPQMEGGVVQKAVQENLRSQSHLSILGLANHFGVDPAEIARCTARHYMEVLHADGAPRERKGFGALVIACVTSGGEEREVWIDEAHRRLPVDTVDFFEDLADVSSAQRVDHFVDPESSLYVSPFQRNIGLAVLNPVIVRDARQDLPVQTATIVAG